MSASTKSVWNSGGQGPTHDGWPLVGWFRKGVITASTSNYVISAINPTVTVIGGVTIGIGYDLGMTPRPQVRADWEPLLSEVDLAALLAVQGITGPAAKQLAQGLAHVKIPLAVAEEVFYTRTLPGFASLTRKNFPGVQRLPADAQGMMLSLVYNRGPATSGSRRVEMANIQKLLRASKPSLPALAREFESMQRLWPDLPGLQARRQREAEVIRASRRRYETGEIVKI